MKKKRRFFRALVEIENGELADADVVNSNFDYLDDRITTVGSGITTLQTNISTLNSTLTAQINSSASSTKTDVLQTIYPVGSIYIGTMETCPLAALFGTWTKKSEGRVLWGSDETNEAGTTIAAGLPNLNGDSKCLRGLNDQNPTVPFYVTNSGDWTGHDGGWNKKTIGFDASRANSIYGNSSTVQPPAYVVNIWERTA